MINSIGGNCFIDSRERNLNWWFQFFNGITSSLTLEMKCPETRLPNVNSMTGPLPRGWQWDNLGWMTGTQSFYSSQVNTWLHGVLTPRFLFCYLSVGFPQMTYIDSFFFFFFGISSHKVENQVTFFHLCNMNTYLSRFKYQLCLPVCPPQKWKVQTDEIYEGIQNCKEIRWKHWR